MSVIEKEKSLVNYPIPVTIKGTSKILKQLKSCICKIENKNGNGTGFFCSIPYKNKLLKVMITNYHIINEKIIKENKKIKVTINNDKDSKIIELKNKIIYSNEKEYDTTIIEINSEKEKIDNYLKLDENIFDDIINIENKSVYTLQYHMSLDGQKAAVSYGIIKNKQNEYNIIHYCSTDYGSSGSPIMNLINNKIIGIHKERVKNKNYNRGTLLKYPIKEYLNKIRNKEIDLALKIDEKDINQNIYYLNKNKKYNNNKDYNYSNYYTHNNENLITNHLNDIKTKLKSANRNNLNEKEKKRIKEIKMNNYCIKITNLFRQLKKEKDDSHEKLYKEYSQIPSSEYILDLNNNEFGVNLAPEQNCLYLGTKFKNKKDGLGLEIFSDTKSKYFGIFRNGKRIGAGRFIISNGFQEYNYYGQIKGIYARGFGWLEDKKNSIYYEGKWENSMKNGYGIEINQNDNSEYRGTFSNGKKHGIGYYLWNDGSYYEGEWKENKLDGYGIYTFKDGSLYKGEWKENELDGFGEFSYPGVKTYIGYFQRDLRNGFGILIWFKIKKVFIGFWKNNKQNGIGKFIKNDKIIYGIWREGELETKINTKIEFDTKLNKGEYGFLKYFQFENYERFYEYMKKFIDMNEKY